MTGIDKKNTITQSLNKVLNTGIERVKEQSRDRTDENDFPDFIRNKLEDAKSRLTFRIRGFLRRGDRNNYFYKIVLDRRRRCRDHCVVKMMC